MVERTSPRDLVGLAALAILSEQPSHPYEIQRQMRWRHMDFAAGKARALYHAIDQLLTDGLVEPVETSREGRRPERTIFRVTAAGNEQLRRWLVNLLEVPHDEHPVFNVAIGFLAYLPKSQAVISLAARATATREGIAVLNEAHRACLQEGALPRVVVLEIEHALALRRAEVDWVESIIDDIRSGRLNWSRELLGERFAEENAAARERIAAYAAAAGSLDPEPEETTKQRGHR
ncbi:MAG: PadR family transcriptional regulator [Candidatus Dormibacteria bacterium]